LTDAQGGIHWFTAWQALGLTAPDLRLPLPWAGDVQQRDGLAATVVNAAILFSPTRHSPISHGRLRKAFLNFRSARKRSSG